LPTPTETSIRLQTRDGVVLTNPFNFEDLYHQFADSWRVNSSLLSACNAERPIEVGVPKQTFFARDLESEIHQKSRGICTVAA
jgi:hypothetical protein